MKFPCPACNQKIRWYERVGGNGSWHYRCWIAWEAGYRKHTIFSNEECHYWGLPTIQELYNARSLLHWGNTTVFTGLWNIIRWRGF